LKKSDCFGENFGKMLRQMMRDVEMRAALKQKLHVSHQGETDTLIVEELGLRHGANRVDLAVVNGMLHGYELKSDRDTLNRLPRQCKTYNAVFDRMTLVVGPRLANRAIEMVPEWWGVELAEPDTTGRVLFATHREPLENPAPDPLAIAKLLWRDEALSLLIELGCARGVLSKPRSYVYARLAEVGELQFLQYRVRDRLRNRSDWRPAARQA
jgi:hypothetical protein